MTMTAETVRQLLDYDPTTGTLSWRERPQAMFSTPQLWKRWNTRYAGTQAGSLNPSGYVLVQIFRRSYRAHRIAWLLQYGEWPSDQIDHINGVKHDNRLFNLRTVSPSENQRNCKLLKTNTSGVCGVSWCNRIRKWNAYIRRNGVQVRLGQFRSFDDAKSARKTAERELGYHPNHGNRRDEATT